MGIAPYHRSYQRARPGGGAQAAGYVPNPACHLTDQGADPDPADLVWCIRRRWRVIYYSARHAAGKPLWPGADDFEALMTDVLLRLSSTFEPIPPICSPKAARPENSPTDVRTGRVFQPSCRVFRTPVLEQRE
jgi:hypothetical protein